jgi:ubiquinone/menaquinone biosynthesis C-methylase UbiE
MAVVSYYAALHHFPEPIDFLREGARVLRKGGVLYTDHDPNYFLVRFYYPLFRLYHLGQTGFGSEEGDLAEYFHTQEPGMNPEPLAEALRDWGFQEVNVQYRQTRNKDLSAVKKLVFSVLQPLSDWTEWRSLFTHFTILARK